MYQWLIIFSAQNAEGFNVFFIHESSPVTELKHITHMLTSHSQQELTQRSEKAPLGIYNSLSNIWHLKKDCLWILNHYFKVFQSEIGGLLWRSKCINGTHTSTRPDPRTLMTPIFLSSCLMFYLPASFRAASHLACFFWLIPLKCSLKKGN